jgi:ADP-heptose:LPS heptosyltransferase
MKILIVRFSSIGDIVLTTPVVRCIKTQIPGVTLHFCTKKSYANLVNANPYIDQVHLLEDSLYELAQKLRKERYDVLIDLHNNTRTRMLKWMLPGVQSHAFKKLNLEKFLYVQFKLDKLPNIHIVDRYLAAAAPLGVLNDEKGLDYFIPDKDVVEISWLPQTHQKGYVAVAIGAQHYTKRLPTGRLIELIDKINKPVVLLGDEQDSDVARKIEDFFKRDDKYADFEEGLQKLNKKSLVFNACGKFNLHQSASIVQQAMYVFTHDTGLMHIAAAFKKHTFSIWGNTTPKFGMYPYKTRFVVLENNKISCRPCSKIGHNSCPKGHFKCMNEIVFDFYLP